LRDLRGKNKQ